jgi:hypothetical protein
MRKIIPIYYLLFGLLLLIVSPLLLFKKKARHGFKQKMGIVPEEIKAKRKSWPAASGFTPSPSANSMLSCLS